MTETTPFAILNGRPVIVEQVIDNEAIVSFDDGAEETVHVSSLDFPAPIVEPFDSGKAFAAILDRLDKTVESARAFKL
jgi:hypothetical protein